MTNEMTRQLCFIGSTRQTLSEKEVRDLLSNALELGASTIALGSIDGMFGQIARAAYIGGFDVVIYRPRQPGQTSSGSYVIEDFAAGAARPAAYPGTEYYLHAEGQDLVDRSNSMMARSRFAIAVSPFGKDTRREVEWWQGHKERTNLLLFELGGDA